ncbi:hypothetical protein GA0070622_5163 [Micromonospora sediminicola]|uniref:Transmembrane protein n=1 Tax=Micromonospora sediminicola TaxID=946078 RepID=A0A1A9BFU4_9ACTN|nr:hypothetical protein [Micromonospora sediminicola]SBT68073.1 hypothetical protein GA0070622_5163 [Micromonospora sediminicola]
MSVTPRRGSPVRLGPPGSYVMFMLIAGLCWLPLRLWDERDGSALVAVVRAGLGGVIWGFLFLFILGRWGEPRTPAEAERNAGWRLTMAALRRGEPPTDEADLAAVTDNLPAVRRGALLGAVGGTVLLGVLIVIALHVGWTGSAIGFGVVLVAVLAQAARTRHRERRLRARLASVQGG